LKKFSSISTSEIHCLVDQMIFGKRKISESEIACVVRFPEDIHVNLINSECIHIRNNWVVSLNGDSAENQSSLYFLLIELGYKV
jgi:hypothetical protein